MTSKVLFQTYLCGCIGAERMVLNDLSILIEDHFVLNLCRGKAGELGEFSGAMIYLRT